MFALGQVNPVQISQHAVRYARDNGFDTVLLDTAGRLHIDEQLMEELKKIKAAVTPKAAAACPYCFSGSRPAWRRWWFYRRPGDPPS